MAPNPFNASSVLCVNGADEVVKVGTGGSAFWIDRYEASLWTASDGPTSGTPRFVTADDSTTSFPKNGQVTVPLYALSVAGVVPSRFVTWFQANEACRSSGKRLPLGDEWIAAARGTTDPGSNNGTTAGNAMCNTSATAPRVTGKGLGTATTSCVSTWGAQDIIGNLWEWTAEWYAGLGAATSTATPWPDATYGGDATGNITSSASNGAVTAALGAPSVAIRGGGWPNGTLAGTFALSLAFAPSFWTNSVGFRCVVPH